LGCNQSSEIGFVLEWFWMTKQLCIEKKKNQGNVGLLLLCFALLRLADEKLVFVF